MKFGCCLSMVSTKPDGTGMEWLEELVGCGYDYVELPMAQIMALSGAEFDALCGHIASLGIVCETSNNFFPASFRLTGLDIDMDTIMDYVERVMARAEKLGVQYLVFGSGPAKNVPEGFPMEEGYRQVVAFLKNIAPVAKRYGVTIVIEPLRKAECNLINSFAEGVRLAKDVDDPAVRVLIDFYHLTEERESVGHLLADGREYLCHVHFANPAGRVFPADAHEADYAPFVDALKEIGYALRVSCEAYAPNGFDRDVPVAKRVFESIF